ncbi:PDDEXK family nuclease [Tautonia plasticadhaerens]|uniref:Restriction endonuclease domain-containing protein n=1 Tax=Tautonia plasticadhaerens TaxID=2527974 RepID=A0A518HFC3_9BACT|nr:Uma2 family endonuclease [Tautonia plasticadhaerens]QDV39531.1 hypothetical protein ElP_75000 [Tautonia plasticadhaerens]
MATRTDPRDPPPADQPETRILVRGVDEDLIDRILALPRGPKRIPRLAWLDGDMELLSFPTRESIAEMPPAPPPSEGAEDRIRLRGVDHALFGRLTALGGNPTKRLARNGADAPSPAPRTGRLDLVGLKATGVPSFGTGRVTLARPDAARGKIAEVAFYVAHVDRGPSRRVPAVDLGVHPPPDLAIEVALGRPLVDVERLYAGLGVPELWRCDGQAVCILRLGRDGRYDEQGRSDVVPGLWAADVMPVLATSDAPDDDRWGQATRRWAREDLANRPA